VGIAFVPIAETKGLMGFSESYTLPVMISGKIPKVSAVVMFGAAA
jgi:hypothetical protein